VKLVEAAADVWADAIKFQTFDAVDICADIALPFGHDIASDAWLTSLRVTRMRELFAKGGLPRDWHAPLRDLAQSMGLAFLSTPFSVNAARFLVNDIGVPALKIASGDLTFTPLLDYAAGAQLPVILSTGASTMAEVRQAVATLRAYDPHLPLALLHCVCQYPCQAEDANLLAIRALLGAAGNPMALGWSDHTLSYDVVPALAVACGATVLEKHLRLDDDHTSIDVGHSLTPEAFSRMVTTVRMTPSIIGVAYKAPRPCEAHERLWIRRDPRDWLRPFGRAREGAWL
jgi:sialic acid synthase SpsE